MMMCPLCGHNELRKYGKSRRYVCTACRETFTNDSSGYYCPPEINFLNSCRDRIIKRRGSRLSRLRLSLSNFHLKQRLASAICSFRKILGQLFVPKVKKEITPPTKQIQRQDIIIIVAVTVVALLIYQGVAWGRNTPFNGHVHLANAWLQGQITPHELPGHMEYVKTPRGVAMGYGSAPAIVLLPWVAIWGLSTNQTIICAATGSLNVGLVWLICFFAGLGRGWCIFFSALFAIGTPHFFYSANDGSTWSFMHILTNTGILIALIDILASRRGWLTGLGLGLAIMTRQTTMLALPFIALMLYKGRLPWRRFISFTICLSVCCLLIALYNVLRFENPLESGYLPFILQGIPPESLSSFQVVSPKYFWTNLDIYFLRPPEQISSFPWWKPSVYGISMWIATPALLILHTNVLASLGAILAMTGFYLCYFWDGTSQFGMRYTLDWLPFAFMMLISNYKQIPQRVWAFFLVLGTLVQIWGLIMWRSAGG
jgi:hypothetical protein